MADQKEILEAIADALTLPVADIDPHASLKDDLGLNPVEIADLFHELADRFQIIFEPGDREGLETVSDLVSLIEDKMLE
jgi:acyl carrier protein